MACRQVGSSFKCPRRSVLDERVQSREQAAPALQGTMLHQLFQVGGDTVCVPVGRGGV